MHWVKINSLRFTTACVFWAYKKSYFISPTRSLKTQINPATLIANFFINQYKQLSFSLISRPHLTIQSQNKLTKKNRQTL